MREGGHDKDEGTAGDPNMAIIQGSSSCYERYFCVGSSCIKKRPLAWINEHSVSDVLSIQRKSRN